ncbi:hypothetical protein MC885_021854 [Smutsia gigantea]|nr:hypothetical protein MC885_021854 [Smutsia gigantea]
MTSALGTHSGPRSPTLRGGRPGNPGPPRPATARATGDSPPALLLAGFRVSVREGQGRNLRAAPGGGARRVPSSSPVPPSPLAAPEARGVRSRAALQAPFARALCTNGQTAGRSAQGLPPPLPSRIFPALPGGGARQGGATREAAEEGAAPPRPRPWAALPRRGSLGAGGRRWAAAAAGAAGSLGGCTQPDGLPAAGPGGTAPDGGTGPLAAATAAREGADGRHRDPAAPPDGGDETLRLLDELLAESAAWGAEEPASRGPARPRPVAGAGSSKLTPTVEVVGLVLSLGDQLDGAAGAACGRAGENANLEAWRTAKTEQRLFLSGDLQNQ